MEAVEHQDIELAELVIADDDRIDGRYLEVHQAILTLLATQAPVATDLRLISALLHVMKSIERMGDQCVNIAKLIPLAGHDPPARSRRCSSGSYDGQAGAREIPQAKQAFAARDVELARGPGPPGRRRRQPQPGVLPARARDRRRPRPARVGDDDDAVARALERIGDNAVDIGEQVAFVVTGLFGEFEDASEPRAASRSTDVADLLASVRSQAPSKPRSSSCCEAAATISPTRRGVRHELPPNLARGPRAAGGDRPIGARGRSADPQGRKAAADEQAESAGSG